LSVDVEFIHRYVLPRCIARGFDFTPRLNIYDMAGAAETLTGPGSYTLNSGGSEIYTTAALTYGAGFAVTTAAVPAAETVDEPLSDSLIETWDVVTTTGARSFTRPCSLVRNVLSSVITDADLIALHSDLAELRDPDQTSFELQRLDAWIVLNGWLIQKGNRPQLIMDDWMLRDVHRSLALHIIFRDFATSVGDGRYSQMAAEYREKAAIEFDRLTPAYDFDEDGANEGEVKAANPVVFLQVPMGWNL